MIGRTGIGLSGSTAHAASDTLQLDDNIQLQFGTGSDSVIYYDGTDTFWDLRAVGNGRLMIAGRASFPSPDRLVHIWDGSAGTLGSSGAANLVLERDGTVYLQFLTIDTGDAGILIGGPTDGFNRANIQYSGSNDRWQIRIDQADRLYYSAAAFAFQEATTISTTTGDLTINPAGVLDLNTFTAVTATGFRIDDDLLFRIGTDSDIRWLNRSFAASADATITNLIIGTPDHQGVAANSLIMSGLTADGDMMFLVNNGGNSLEFLMADASATTLRLAHGFTTLEWGIAGTLEMSYTTGAMAFQQATTLSTTTGAMTFSASVNSVFTTDLRLNDNQDLIWGTSGDIKARHTSVSLAADEEVATLIEGTSVHQGVAANSWIISNISNDGDMMMLVSDGGNSLEFLLADADVADLQLGHGMATVTVKTDSGDLTLNPGADVQMGADVFIEHDTNAGLTASDTQSQGQGALTTEINEIATVGADGDTVTMPAAAAGRRVTIINNGANTLQMFPASGDDLGAGVDVSEELEPNETITFVAYDGTNWRIEASTEIIHAEMFDFDNTDAYVVNEQTSDHMYHTNGMQAGDLAEWTFDAGGAGTSFPIASIADGAASGVDIAVTTTGTHGLAVGDIISQTNLTSAVYTGTFIVKAIISTTVYEVAAVFTATDTGTMDQAAVLIAGADAAGQYLVNWATSGTSAANNETFDFAIHIGAAHEDSTNSRRKFGTAGDVGNVSGVSIIPITGGDKVSFMVANVDSAANITLRDFTMVLVRL